VYTHFDDTGALPDGAVVHYRAVLDYDKRGTRTVTSAARSVTVVQTPVTEAVIHYQRTDGAYADWGLHLFDGNPPGALAPGEATVAWTNATPFEGTDDYGVFHRIRLADDTKPIGFIVHGKPPGGNPDVKDTDPDRFFVPLESPEIWLKQGDPTIYKSKP
jgi:alpha-amylase